MLTISITEEQAEWLRALLQEFQDLETTEYFDEEMASRLEKVVDVAMREEDL